MSDLNVCSITGRLTRDAELKRVGAKQTPCASFSLANNTGFGEYANTSYFDVQLWGARSESLLPYLKKATRVAVSGSMEQNSWVDNNGDKHTVWRVNARDLVLLGSPQGQGQGQQMPNAPTLPYEAMVF